MQAGDRIRIERETVTVEGVVLPSSTDEHVVVKRDGGYNVGIDRSDASIEVLESDVHRIGTDAVDDAGTSTVEFDESLPTVSLLSTGGTIASTVDYRTGAVSPRFDVEDVIRAVPELQGIANYRGRVVTNILSENMTPAVWQDLADAIAEEIAAGADGIVVMHGTDTMQFSASAIAFMLDTPVPIVFTGSQRSADRPSSDNVMNATCAVRTATADIAEVLVCMHATESDDRCAIHRGTRVRKNHTSRRAAFETVGGPPLASMAWESGDLDIRPGATYEERGDAELTVETDLHTDIELVKFTPGSDPGRLAAREGDVGVVIEGTGLGHVNADWLDVVEDLVASGTDVVMTSQCLDGRICDRVYETGRDLLDAGVIEAGNTLPETALVKLMWASANVDNVRKVMGQSLAGELTARTRPPVDGHS